MNDSYTQCSLFLCPIKHEYTTENQSELISRLKNIGLLDEAIKDRKNAYLTGDRFLNHVAYMGCAPAIQFEPADDNSDYCHINLHFYDSARLIYNKARCRAPHCPRCHKPVDDWREQLSAAEIYCQQCQSHSPVDTIEWKKTAGYARLFIEITDVYPKEAIPQTALLERLSTLSNTQWRYFYSCQ